MGLLAFLFWSAFLIGFSGAMMPGPVLTATVSETLKRGFWAGPLIVLGHAILEIAMLTAVILGLSAWISRESVKFILGIGGGALLIIMGTHMALTAKAAVKAALTQRERPQKAIGQPVWIGLVTSISNPYWTIWWATTGLYYASLALQHGIAGLVSFYAGHILSDLMWYSLISAAVTGGRMICPAGVYRALIVLCGLALVALGAFFGASSVAHWI